MRIETVQFQHRGKTIEGDVGFPETLDEAMAALGPKEVFDYFTAGYREAQKKLLIPDRRVKKFLRVKIEELSDDQRAVLKAAGFRVP